MSLKLQFEEWSRRVSFNRYARLVLSYLAVLICVVGAIHLYCGPTFSCTLAKKAPKFQPNYMVRQVSKSTVSPSSTDTTAESDGSSHKNSLKIPAPKTSKPLAIAEKVARIRVSEPANNKEFYSKWDLTKGRKRIPMFNDSVILQPEKEAFENFEGLLMVVLSTSKDVDRRRIIRNTWGSVANTKSWPGSTLPMDVNIVFLIGMAKTDGIVNNTMLAMEHRHQRDILQFDMTESYRNLTRKVLLGLQWIHQNCPKVEFVLKVDSDSFPNIPLLTWFLKERASPNSIYGARYPFTNVIRRGKWAVSTKLAPYPKYMPYTSGPGYVLTRDALGPILNASEHIAALPFEDVFITGLCAMIGKVNVYNVPGFSTTQNPTYETSDFVTGSKIVGTGYTIYWLKKIWNAIETGLAHS